MNPRRLYRCRHDRQLAGVAAGMADYLEIDPTLVRILWILSAFLGGFTILLYVILAFVIPLEPAAADSRAAGTDTEAGGVGDPGGASPPEGGSAHQDWSSSRWQSSRHDLRPDDRRGGRTGLYAGVLLVVFGAIAMANTLIPGWGLGGALGPALLVALGVALLVGSARRTADER